MIYFHVGSNGRFLHCPGCCGKVVKNNTSARMLLTLKTLFKQSIRILEMMLRDDQRQVNRILPPFPSVLYRLRIIVALNRSGHQCHQLFHAVQYVTARYLATQLQCDGRGRYKVAYYLSAQNIIGLHVSNETGKNLWN